MAKSNTLEESWRPLRYNIFNWGDYNKSLIQRGNLLLYFDQDVEDWWFDQEDVLGVGSPRKYSDRCIETVLILKSVFKLAYRQTEGFVNSLLNLMNINNIKSPSYTQINRRSKDLDVGACPIQFSNDLGGFSRCPAFIMQQGHFFSKKRVLLCKKAIFE